MRPSFCSLVVSTVVHTKLCTFRVTAKLCSLCPDTLLQHPMQRAAYFEMSGKACHLEGLYYFAVLFCRFIRSIECRSYLLQRLYSVSHSAAQEESVSLLPRSHTVTGGAVQLLLASICLPFALTPIPARAPAGTQRAQSLSAGSKCVFAAAHCQLCSPEQTAWIAACATCQHCRS